MNVFADRYFNQKSRFIHYTYKQSKKFSFEMAYASS